MTALLVIVIIVALIAILACKGQTWCNDIRNLREGMSRLAQDEQAHSYMFGAGAIDGVPPQNCPKFNCRSEWDCRSPKFLGPNSPECIWTGKRTGFQVVVPGSSFDDYGFEKCDPYDIPHCGIQKTEQF